MKMLFTLFVQTLVVALVAGFPGFHDPHGGHGGHGGHGPWPSHGIARSPCPALNALANENALPFSGRNITANMTLEAFKNYLNFDNDVILTLVEEVLVDVCANLTHVAKCETYDLDMLNLPHAAEHDGSLSRQDFNYGRGDNHDFNPYIWNEVMDLWARNGASADDALIDFSLAESARFMRMTLANETDLPEWFDVTTAINFQSLGETAFYMTAFGDPVKGNARKDWVHYFFTHEQFPYELGWNATQRQLITADLVYAMIAELAEAKIVQ